MNEKLQEYYAAMRREMEAARTYKECAAIAKRYRRFAAEQPRAAQETLGETIGRLLGRADHIQWQRKEMWWKKKEE